MDNFDEIARTLGKLKCSIHAMPAKISVVGDTMNFVTCCTQFRITLLPIAQDLIDTGYDSANQEYMALATSIDIENALKNHLEKPQKED